MKINYKFITSLCLIFLMTLSCQEDFLEIDPFGTLSETTLSTEAGVNNLLIGAYAVLANGYYRHGLGYIRGTDENCIGTESGITSYDAFAHTVNSGFRFWDLGYSGILRCNEVLKMLPKAEGINTANALQIEAEAKFLRGVYYMELLMLFRNVPWIDETINYAEKNYFVPNTVDVYPKVEADFKFAGDNLTDTKPEVGRANKWAAKSFLAKAYMFQNKWSDAKTVLDDVIANGQTSNGLKYELLEEYNLNFIQRGKHGSEAVFTVQMDISDLARNANGNPRDRINGTYGGPATCCYGWTQPTFDLVDAFQTDPVTGLPLLDTYMDFPLPNDNGLSSSDPYTPYTGTLDSRMDWCIGRRGIPYRDWGVHPGKAWVRNQFNAGPYNCIKNICESATVATDRGSGGATNNAYNLIRFADVLLWAAECEVEVGSLARAEELVNIVRARAANPVSWVKTYIDDAVPLGGFTDTPAANYFVGLYNGEFAANGQSYARKAVRYERRIELAMEHHRFFDLVRYDGNDFDVEAWCNGYIARDGDRYLNKNNRFLTGAVFVRNQDEYLPIPLIQIDLSVVDGEPVLVQNPGYN